MVSPCGGTRSGSPTSPLIASLIAMASSSVAQRGTFTRVFLAWMRTRYLPLRSFSIPLMFSVLVTSSPARSHSLQAHAWPSLSSLRQRWASPWAVRPRRYGWRSAHELAELAGSTLQDLHIFENCLLGDVRWTWALTVNGGHVVQAVMGGRVGRESYPDKLGAILVGAITRDAGVKGLIEPRLSNSSRRSVPHFPYYGRRIALFNQSRDGLPTNAHLLSYTASFFVGLTFESRLNNRSPAT